ncbi:hypothetical protein BLA23254_07999 [Burkholderia lata]|uniref:Uncharacterized protein n=1 Tax=Burkholderia lata (strain ATCC 17760 / DSM 23089 / LMG 22485 / NCIMB 9086 / R18194 / 383) TaxID=482957 RepID=A0A6P2SNH7_BURL3|nr:hypothetical protein [Burkholderia lata]VWC52300.1 hypothetical protein BLA23254_07999 [Burkholderia lata]
MMVVAIFFNQAVDHIFYPLAGLGKRIAGRLRRKEFAGGFPKLEELIEEIFAITEVVIEPPSRYAEAPRETINFDSSWSFFDKGAPRCLKPGWGSYFWRASNHS